MKIIEHLVEPLVPMTEAKAISIMKEIEIIGRTSYKSYDKISDNSYMKFINMIMTRGHLGLLEHHNITFKIVANRAILNELTRHRIGVSFVQESTRFVNYNGKDMCFILPESMTGIRENISLSEDVIEHYQNSETLYCKLIERGVKPEEARDVLPLGLASEIHVTANFRAWRNILLMRFHKTAHPQIREIMKKILDILLNYFSIMFEDIPHLVSDNSMNIPYDLVDGYYIVSPDKNCLISKNNTVFDCMALRRIDKSFIGKTKYLGRKL